MTTVAFVLGFLTCGALQVFGELLHSFNTEEETMRPRNRIKAATRWPLDPNKRLERARLDLDFVRALHACEIDVGSRAGLMRLEREASIKAQSALHEIDG